MKNMKKFVAIATALTMVIAPMTAFAATELEQEGDVNYTNTTIYKLTLPTTEGMAFTLDPQGLTALDDEDEGTTVTTNAGKIVAPTPMTAKNQSSVDVKLEAKFYLEDSADETGAAFVEEITADEDTGVQAGKQIAMTVTANTTSPTTINVAGNSEVAATPFTMAKVAYSFVKNESGEYAYTPDVPDAATTLNFQIGGFIAKDYDWSAYTGDEAETITLHAVFTFKDAAGTGEVENTVVEEPEPEDTYVMALQEDGTVAYTFVNAPEGSITELKVDGTSRMGAVTANYITYSEGVLTFNTNATNTFLTAAGEHSIVATIGGADYTLTYTVSE